MKKFMLNLSRCFWLLFAAAAILSAGEQALADHSLGNKCVDCHSLRSMGIVPGSRNILSDRVNDPLYNSVDWYCATTWITTAAVQPLDCSYCHETDIAFEIQSSNDGLFGSAHPVDVLGDGVNYAAGRRIVCNDCHNGKGASAVPELTPDTLCSKSATDGYPNHLNVVVSPTSLPGLNDVTNNPPRLTYPYGTSVDWTKTTFLPTDVVCFICHDQNPATDPPYTTNLNEAGMENILADYNAVGGGHNFPGTGLYGNKKLGCYFCHDPHASTPDPDVPGVLGSKALISNAGDLGLANRNPYDPTATFSYAGFDGTNDRAMCLGCHANAAAKVEGVTPVQFQASISTANLTFGFHANVHSAVASSGNCLNNNGGCHSVHNTSVYNCLDCHTKSVGLVNAKMAHTANVDSEFDLVGNVIVNGIKSQHNIPYNESGDLSSNTNNGCLSCHNVANSVVGRKVGLPNGTTFAPPTMADRQSLSAYNAFCNGCHDGSNNTGEAFGSMLAPRVEKYYSNGGHGTGFGSDVFPSKDKLGNTTPNSNIPCLECHVYHGSTAYKLLPGDVQTLDWANKTLAGGTEDAGGRVVKGFDYMTGANNDVTGVRFTIGGVTSSLKIDYKDYSLRDNNTRVADNKRKAIHFSDYTNTSPWNNYYSNTNNTTMPVDPIGTMVSYGTTGDKFDDASLVTCSDTATSASKIGFCDACHLYSNTTDGTTATFNKSMTHRSQTTGRNCAGKDLTTDDIYGGMVRDCTECHDPHGSGSESTNNPNWYMVKGKILTGYDPTPTTNWDTYNVVLDEPGSDGIFSGPDSLDEADTDNKDDICAVCHTLVGHNLRSGTVADHNTGNNCVQCHPHDDGFYPSGSCDSCHGYPPVDPADSTANAVPPEENYSGGGGPHKKHVDMIIENTGVLVSDWPSKVICGPCHGDTSGTVNHANSGLGAASWPTASARPYINIQARTASAWGAGPSYGGQNLPVGSPNVSQIPGNAMDLTDSRCSNVDCHGTPATYDSTVNISWYLTAGEPDVVGAASPSDGLERSKVCQTCHDLSPGNIRLYDANDVLVYSNTNYKGVVDAAANYYGTVSGYGRGGHGDAKLANPTYGDVDSDPAHVPPIDCTACHNPDAKHIPSDAANNNRLLKTVENAAHVGGICNDCHVGTDYPGTTPNFNHHPSYVGPSVKNPIVTDTIGTNVTNATTWTADVNGKYSQSGYGAGGSVTVLGKNFNLNANPDRFTDWYNRGGSWIPFNAENHNQTDEPRPVFLGENGSGATTTPSRVVLPLEQYVYGQGPATNVVVCVTCHNPHGTDLYVHDPFVDMGKRILDNNMLRLQYVDDALCTACH